MGRSAPLRCLKSSSLDRVVATDPDPDDPDEIDDLHRAFRSVGKACVARSGALASHVSTDETARDLDVLRALMGQRTLDYYGASYGTQLGAQYATRFPRKVGAMVLDGAVDPTLDKEQQAYDQAQGFQRAFKAFLRRCVDRTSTPCTLGSTVKQAQQTVVDLLDALDRQPIRTRADRRLTEGSAAYGMAYALYDKSSWDALERGLARASFGDGTILLTLGDQYYGRRVDGSYPLNSTQAGFAIRCLDYPGTPSDTRVEDRLAAFTKASPVFGRVLAWSATECRGWPAKASRPQGAVKADGPAPIVVIGSTRDPATPYEWARALSRQLTSSVLVTRKGDGHTAYGLGNRCVDRVVDRYLALHEEPASAVTCDDT